METINKTISIPSEEFQDSYFHFRVSNPFFFTTANRFTTTTAPFFQPKNMNKTLPLATNKNTNTNSNNQVYALVSSSHPSPSPAPTLAEVVEINPKTASEKDDNLPSPPNLSQCSTSQLAYLFNKLCKEEDSKASTNQREMVKQVALQILSTCSHTQILEPHTLFQIPVLALMEDDDILKELMRVLVEKIRDESFIDRYKLRAISQVVCYGGSRLKDANMVLKLCS
jgi:hypothetical protein